MGMMIMIIVTVKTILLVVRITFRSLKKKVGEYQKLTGELPGIWRLAIIGHQPSAVLLPSIIRSLSIESSNQLCVPGLLKKVSPELRRRKSF